MKKINTEKLLLIALGLGAALIVAYDIYLNNGGASLRYYISRYQIEKERDEEVVEKIIVADGRYQDFSEEAFAEAVGKRRIYFFHAVWCSTCKVAHQDFLENASKLPADVAIFKIDYDSNKALRQKFGIPFQHTFVEVDANGNKIQMWSGGAVDEVLEFTK